MNYRLLVDWDVVAFIERLPRRTGRQLRNAIEMIGKDPLGHSDAEDQDETGRKLEVSIVGDFAIIYWVDDADRHVKILDVHGADC